MLNRCLALMILMISCPNISAENITTDFFESTTKYLESTYGENWSSKLENIDLVNSGIRLRFFNGMDATHKHNTEYIYETEDSVVNMKLLVEKPYRKRLKSVSFIVDGDENPFISKTVIGHSHWHWNTVFATNYYARKCGKYYAIIVVESSDKKYWGYRPFRTVAGDCWPFR